MQTLATVIGTFSAPEGQSGLPRPQAERLKLVKGHGIVGDKFARKDLNQTVMIVGKTAYDIAEKGGVKIDPGSLGENILIDGDPHQLSVGTRLHVGSAIIELTEACTLCNHLSVFDRRLPKLVRHDRGVYCRIIAGGTVEVGDTVSIESRMSA